MSIGQKIRELRIAKGLTQSDLGAGLVTPSMISQIESDKANPSYKVLDAIAQKLEMPLEFFLTDIKTQLERTSRFKVAKSLIKSGNYGRAAELLEPMLQDLAPTLNEAEVRLDLGICLSHVDRAEEAKGLMVDAENLFVMKGNLTGQIRALLHLGLIFMDEKKPHKAIVAWSKAYDLLQYQTSGDPFLHSEVLRQLAAAYLRLGEFNEALVYNQDAYRVLKKTNHIMSIGLTLMEIAENYNLQNEYEMASDYAEQAAAIFTALENIKLNVEVKLQFGVSLRALGRYEEAMGFFQQCVEACQQYSYEAELGAVYCEMAMLHYLEKNYEKALQTINHSLKLISEGTLSAGKVFLAKGRIEGEIGNTESALHYHHRALDLFREHRQPAEIVDAYRAFADLYEKQGEFETATRYLREMDEARKSHLRDRGIVLV